MEELRIEEFYNKPYHQKLHRRNKLLNHKQKIVLAYSVVGSVLFIVGMVINEVVKLFS
jgi:hypothetical protein